MVQKDRYVQIDTKYFIQLCNENAALKQEVILLENHVEQLHHSIQKLSGANRKLTAQVNANNSIRESKFRRNLYDDITSFDSIVEENFQLKRKNSELKEKLSD